MQVMARLGDISWKSKICKISLVAVSLLAMTGCTSTTIDSIRPEVNRHQAMLVFPEQYSEAISEVTGQDGTGETSTEEETVESDTAGTIVGNTAAYDPLPYNVVASSDYNKYLDEQVYQPIKKVLDSLPNNAAQHFYFRVFHSGYEPVSGDSSAIQTGSIYDNRMIGTGTNLAGKTVQEFAVGWLSKTPANEGILVQKREAWLQTIESQQISTKTTWMEAVASGSVDKNVIQMWGNEDLACDTLSEYLMQVRSTAVGTIPNIYYKYYMPGGSFINIVVNDTAGVTGNRYTNHMAKTYVDRLFNSYNQYPNRDKVINSFDLEDEYGRVFSYIDGYSKTLIVLCCFEGYDFKSLLGNKEADVSDIFSGIRNYTEWARIAEYVPDAKIIQAGVRGIN